ncbi:MAG: Bug family tripartite tricarboxylate transporter substrate binding protein [Steroidobacteraceae bacterium]
MKVPRCRALTLLMLIGTGSMLFGGAAFAQSFPSRTVKIVVPFPAGGSADVIARLVAEKLSREWPQAVVVENRSGVNGGLGADVVTKSPPDGHTILFATSPVFTTNKLLYKNLPYDPDRDFRPLSLAAVAPNVLGIYPKLPVKHLRELIAYAKAHPGELTFASQGNASTGHLTATLFSQLAGVEMKHIPYRGAAPAWTDVIGGHVAMMWDGIPSILAQIRAGTVRALAVGSRQRSPALPDVPTAIEAGLANFESESWFATAVSHDTPDELAQTLSQAIAAAIRSPEVSARIVQMGARPVGSTPDELSAYIAATTAQWKHVIETANIRIE